MARQHDPKDMIRKLRDTEIVLAQGDAVTGAIVLETKLSLLKICQFSATRTPK